ncbi:MAG: signal recognition particle receptor FtsY [Pirellulaceae bacterium]|nr:MAG: signal recognition particle receptor FtsY [Pirellulaceae bacterium]
MVFWKRKKQVSPPSQPSDRAVGQEQAPPPPEQGSPPPAEQLAPPDSTSSSSGPLTGTPPSSLPPEPVSPKASEQEQPKKSGFFSGIKRALQKTSRALNTDIRDLWKSKGELVDEEFLKRLFALLVKTDMGADMAKQIRDSIGKKYRARKVEYQEILDVIADEIRQTLEQGGTELTWAASGPTVILVVGVNGSGKTTSIAKLANQFARQGKKVLLGAGDTFRAAAVEQLTIWADRIGCDIVTVPQGADPGVVAFQASKKAAEENYDVLILDTAGRLQTQSNLMQELQKIRRVIAKHIEGAPHEVLLVLDATAGQNAISQARGFSEAAGCTGIVLAKIDGTAKGGVIVPIRQQFSLPVKFVGVGEKLEDLEVFDPESFTQGLLQENDEKSA